MRFRVGTYYNNSKYIGVFKCVSRLGDDAYFRQINEDKMMLENEMKTSDDGQWIEIDQDAMPERYSIIEE